MKRQVYLLVGMGHHALAWESTSLRKGELSLNGGMEEREGEYIERKMVSRHSNGPRIMIGSEGVI